MAVKVMYSYLTLRDGAEPLEAKPWEDLGGLGFVAPGSPFLAVSTACCITGTDSCRALRA